MTDWTSDPVVVELREQIERTDHAILDRVNERIVLVDRLRRYKLDRGYPFLDQARQGWVLARLAELNPGPLSEEGLRELFTTLIEVGKREVAEDGGGP